MLRLYVIYAVRIYQYLYAIRDSIITLIGNIYCISLIWLKVMPQQEYPFLSWYYFVRQLQRQYHHPDWQHILYLFLR
jgi:hypothetical protein